MQIANFFFFYSWSFIDAKQNKWYMKRYTGKTLALWTIYYCLDWFVKINHELKKIGMF